MEELLHKFNLLDSASKKELGDYLDFLLSRTSRPGNGNMKSYKRKILTVSTWTDEDIKAFHDVAQLFSQWKPANW